MKLLTVVISVAFVMLICVTVALVTEPGSRIFEMVFHRSFVQFLTLYVFALIITLLVGRVIAYLRNRSELRRIRKGNRSRRSQKSPLAHHMSTLHKGLVTYGGGAAIRCAEQFSQQQKDIVCKAYNLINTLIGFLPALGLFGTMLGLGQSLFAAFSSGEIGPEQSRQFVGSLAIALDTTILGLVCAMVAGLFTWLLNRVENDLCEQQTGFVREIFSIEELDRELNVAKATPASSNSHSCAEVNTLKAELRTLSAEILAEFASRVDKSLHNIDEFCRRGLEQSANKSFADQHPNEPIAVEKIASHLTKAVDNIGVLINRHNNHLICTVTSAIKNLTESLEEKIPSELVIRYNHNNKYQMEVSDVA
jgi:biopolymer transport protein ExbB/TolQ